MSGSLGSKPLPRKLQRALDTEPKYKPSAPADPVAHALAQCAGAPPPADPHSFERRLLNDILGPHDQNSRPTSTGASALRAPSEDADTSLVSTMATRLNTLEQASKRQRAELIEKDKTIAKIRQRNRTLEEAAALSQEGAVATQLQTLEAENNRLRGQVHEMEQFLADYGLVWVGSSEPMPAPPTAAAAATAARPPPSADATHAAATAQAQAQAPPPAAVPPPPCPLPLLLSKLKELNSLVPDQGAPQISHTGRRARFEDQDSVRITVFSNGLLVKSGPFRSFGEPNTHAFVQDVLDGYFPSEFREQFPDGVVLVPHDRSTETYGEDFEAFSGQGKQLGRKACTLADIGGSEFPVNSDQLLRRLPDKILKNGRVVDIRGGVRDRLFGHPTNASEAKDAQPAPGDVDLVLTPALLAMQKHECDTTQDQEHDITAKESGAGSHARVTSLRVRKGADTRPFLLKMRFEDTIATLQQQVASHLGWECEQFELRTAFPNRAYTDMSQTLHQAQLTPNATLILRQL